MKRFKKSKKLIALFLSVSMLTVMVGAIEAPEDAAPISDTYALEALPQNVRSVLQEKEQIVSVQRDDELFSITTNNADGTKTATVFAIPVKYENENGEIELIDTAMVSNGILENIFQGYQYRNKANSFAAEFSTDVKKGVRMTTEDGSITMAPVTATASLMSANATPLAVTAAVEEAVENAEMNDAFVYENVFGSGTRIKYYNTLNGIKEDIILDQNIGKNRFDFEINTNGDIPMLTEDAAMIFVYDKDDPTEMKYRFGSLYAYDSYTGEASESGFRHLTEECYYELTDLGNSKYRVTVVVPAEWLNHPELVYPVTIDPTVEDYSVDNSAVNVDDTYVRESEPTKNYYLETRLRIGNYNGADYTDGKCHTFIHFTNMPSLTEVTVTEATLTMHLLSGQTTAQPARTWRVTTPWTGSTLTWNNRPANSESSWATLPTALSYYSFQVEGIVNAWYSGASNYGFLINYVDSTADDLNSLYSSDCGISNKMPTLVMTYTTDHKPIANGTYFIRNKKSNLYLDACNSGGSGTNVGQYTFNGGLNQQWVVTYVRAGYYRISPAYNTGLSLEVENGGGSNGTNIRVATSATISTQRWKIFSSPYDTYRLLSKCSHDTRALAVENASTTSGANVIQYEFNGTKNDQWVFEPKKQTIRHNGDILIGLSSDAYGTSKNDERCKFGYRGSATESANYFAQYITSSMYTGYNNRQVLFNRQNEQASKNDFLSKTLYNISGYNIDDVDLMFFCGHGRTTSGLHFSYVPNNATHAANPSSHDNTNLNLPHNQLKLGYGGSKTKWLVAYTCNFLTAPENVIFPMMEGGHIIMGYASTSYLVRNQMGQLGLDFKLAETNMIDAYFNTSSYHTQYANFDATLAAICIPQARYDTIYDYVDSSETYRDTKILYLTKFAQGNS